MNTYNFSFQDRDLIADPRPAYRKALELAPAFRNELMGCWIASSYDACVTVFNTPELFTSTVNGEDFTDQQGMFVDGANMIKVDPPEHGPLRSDTSRFFVPRAIAPYEPRVREIVQDLLSGEEFRDVVGSGGAFDLMRYLIDPLPNYIIADLMGVPAEDQDLFVKWSRDLAFGVGAVGDTYDQDGVQRSRIAAVELREYIHNHLERARRKGPTDDLTGSLIRAEREGRMTQGDAHSTGVLLLLAGIESTARFFANCIQALATLPEARMVYARPDMPAGAVEELLRLHGPSHCLPRRAARDSDLLGVPIKEGDLVFAFSGAANRDPGKYSDPDVLDPNRPLKTNEHLAFGVGRHLCLGAELVRIETRAALPVFLEKVPDYEIAEVEYGPSFFVRGPSRLVIQPV
jgi:cytochrome P450